MKETESADIHGMGNRHLPGTSPQSLTVTALRYETAPVHRVDQRHQSEN